MSGPAAETYETPSFARNELAKLDQKALLRDIKAELGAVNRKQRRYLLAYAQTGGVRTASKVTGILWTAHYQWLNSSEVYREAFAKARELFADYAEQDVFERAFLGQDKQVLGKDGAIRLVTSKSDVLAMFALKGLRPMYRDNAQVSVNIAGPSQINIALPTPPTPPNVPNQAPAETAKLVPYEE